MRTLRLPNGITDAQLIAALRALSEIIIRTPRKEDADKFARERDTNLDLLFLGSAKTYQDRFGSWNRAIELAGLIPNEGTTGHRWGIGRERKPKSLKCPYCGGSVINTKHGLTKA